MSLEAPGRSNLQAFSLSAGSGRENALGVAGVVGGLFELSCIRGRLNSHVGSGAKAQDLYLAWCWFAASKLALKVLPEFNPSAPGEYVLEVAPLALREAGTNLDTFLILAPLKSDLSRTPGATP